MVEKQREMVCAIRNVVALVVLRCVYVYSKAVDFDSTIH